MNNFMQASTFVGIFIYVFSNGEKKAPRFMFIMMRTLQIIMHLPLMRVIFPANVICLFRVLMPALSFDFLDAFFDWEEQTYIKFDMKRQYWMSDYYYT